MKKSNKIKLLLIGLLTVAFSSCSDFFEPDNDTTLHGDDYIKENSELSSGFLGIITKMQAIGDKAIYLTDMRGELLEPTTNTPAELYSIYNYDDDLTGNSYADPAKYYDVVIACNDYLQKAKEFKNSTTTVDEDEYKRLISSTLRVKAWVYLTIGKIYGEAIWFDDPLQNMKDIANLEPINLDKIVESCDNLLNTGYDGVDGTHSLAWGEWLDPSATTITDEHKRWNMMVPGYFVLQAEIALWKGDYEKAAKLILGEMGREWALPENNTNNSYSIKHMRTLQFDTGRNGDQFTSTNPVYVKTESVIMYDYQFNQQNALLKHFDRSGGYMLRASVAGVDRFTDISFNPPSGAVTKTSDGRFSAFKEVTAGEEYAVQKYRGWRRSDHTVAHDDVHIMIYHTSDLYFMAIEALNHTGRYQPASALLNMGLHDYYITEANQTTDIFVNGDQWKGLGIEWLRGVLFQNIRYDENCPVGHNRAYQDLGIRGSQYLGSRDFWQTPDDIKDEEGLEGLSDEDKIRKHNDLELVKEALLEFPCEGKTYPFMIRIAKRWNDYSFIARYVSEKYPDPVMQGMIREKILNGAYFVPWDLKSKATSH